MDAKWFEVRLYLTKEQVDKLQEYNNSNTTNKLRFRGKEYDPPQNQIFQTLLFDQQLEKGKKYYEVLFNAADFAAAVRVIGQKPTKPIWVNLNLGREKYFKPKD